MILKSMVSFNISDIGLWFISLYWQICTFFFGITGTLMELIMNLASLDLFKQEIVKEVTTRIYLLLGIIMLFKIAISCVQFLLNPSGGKDGKGLTDIVKRTAICVLLLAFVPTIFSFAKKAQNVIVKQIPKIVTGVNANESYARDDGSIDFTKMGDDIAYTTYISLISFPNGNCNPGMIAGLPDSTGEIATKDKTSSVIVYDFGTLQENIGDLLEKKCEKKRVYTSTVLLLPIAVFMIYIMVSLTINVGVRTIKFGILELISPICIASYIDPTTAGKSFKSWKDESIKVYIDLFVNIIVIYLCLFFIEKIILDFMGTRFVIEGNELTMSDFLLKVCLIVSMFFFMKEAPKWICKMLGVSGEGSIGDMFKRASGLFGTTSALGRNMRVQGANAVNRHGHSGKGAAVASYLRGAIMGAASTLAEGGKSFMNNKGFKDTRAATTARAKHDFDTYEGIMDAAKKAKVSKTAAVLEYAKQKHRVKLGYDSPSAANKVEIEVSENASNKSKEALDFAHGKILGDKLGSAKLTQAGNSRVYKDLQNKIASVLAEQTLSTGEKIDFNDVLTGKKSMSEMQLALEGIVNDTTGKYSASDKAWAKGANDNFTGIIDDYLVSTVWEYDQIKDSTSPEAVKRKVDLIKSLNSFAVDGIKRSKTEELRKTYTEEIKKEPANVGKSDAEISRMVDDKISKFDMDSYVDNEISSNFDTYEGPLKQVAFLQRIQSAVSTDHEHLYDTEYGGVVRTAIAKDPDRYNETTNMGAYLGLHKKTGMDVAKKQKDKAESAKVLAEKKARELAEKNKK